MLRSLIFTGAVALILASPAAAQIVLNGDLDDLPVGTNPDCSVPAGAWVHYPNTCETVPEQFEIVPTSDFEDGAAGNSLHQNVDLEAGQANTNIHLPNLFLTTIHEDENPLVTVTFDIWVVEAGVGGGIVYLGGDHGGGGTSIVTDRGPHPGWLDDGTIKTADPECPITLLEDYPVGVWQTVRLEINLAADTFDFWWAERGDPLIRIGDDLVFLSDLTHIDRLTFVHFAGGPDCLNFGSTHSYLDNVAVSVCLPDTNLDGVVDVADLVAVILAWGSDDPRADTNSDGTVNVFDLASVILNWGPCPFA